MFLWEVGVEFENIYKTRVVKQLKKKLRRL